MNIIALTKENIEKEHICCAISSKSTQEGVDAKKQWLTARMEEGLTFKKLDVRGKVLIEYIPGENAWLPIDADGYIVINCFWVSGSFKGKGHAKALLAECEADARARGCKGVTAIVGNKKKPFLADKAFLMHHGYEVCDDCPPYFELMVKRFDQKEENPSFRECAKQGLGDGIKGIDIFFTAQCPYTMPYIKMLEPVILSSEYPVRTHHITTGEMARQHFCPVTTYSVFLDGKYVSNEILTPDKLQKLLNSVL